MQANGEKNRTRWILLALSAAGLALGLLLDLSGKSEFARLAFAAGTIPVLLGLLLEIFTSLRRAEFGLDIVAALSMSAALMFGETLAGAVVALMYSGGTFLESFAEGRAMREMHDLLSRVPRTALRQNNSRLEEVKLSELVAGDRLLIRQGDAVPVDGSVAKGLAVVDQSALTGESMPLRLTVGERVMSGSTNTGDAFTMRASASASESTYAGIVRLVEAAQKSRAPMSRLADRYSLVFLVLTLVIAAAAWIFSGDPIRAVAVLVVATPCPLILAVPVALVGGLSRAASFGVLIKGAKALESLARVKTLILDKTGTLTGGRPRIVAIEPANGFEREEILALAASLDQVSKHPIAHAIVAEAKAQGHTLTMPGGVVESAGEGVRGTLKGRMVVVGGIDYVLRQIRQRPHPASGGHAGSVVVALAVGGKLAGRILIADTLREGTASFLGAMRKRGVSRILLATGDRRAVAMAVADELGLDGISADLSPDQKVLLVLSERKNGPVMMVGDGVNDAPALAAADVGVAMGARGTAASAEAAEIVLLVDRLEPLLRGLEIAQRSVAIALQSVFFGIGLSVGGMIASAFGYLTPLQGALLQEAIDVAVIVNALRALKIRPAGLNIESA